MSTIENFLRKHAEKQLDKASKAVEDGGWFDKLVEEMNSAVDKGLNDPNSSLNPEVAEATKKAITTLENNKEKVVGLGSEAFTLMVSQLASGRDDDAAKTYLQAMGSADLIIKAMDQGTYGLIEAKKQIDNWHEKAWEVIKDIAIKGAQHLLPLLLALI